MAQPEDDKAQQNLEASAAEKSRKRFPCPSCGSDLTQGVGDNKLVCKHCGFERSLDLTAAESKVQEHDLLIMLEERHSSEAIAAQELHCPTCAAVIVFAAGVVSDECCYCGSPVARDDIKGGATRIAIDGVLNFKINEAHCQKNLRSWVGGLWFAPNQFKKKGVAGKFSSMYLPFFNFDVMTHSRYRGERGTYYTVRVGSGKNARTVRKTRWRSVSGTFEYFFDNILLPAQTRAQKSLFRSLEPWPLSELKVYRDEHLAGQYTLAYDLSVPIVYASAKELMRDHLLQETRRRIGGDTQRIHSLDDQYSPLAFQYVLLPVWLLAYRYHGKSYQVLVNASTGEVVGERPYSALKITFAVILALLALLILYYIYPVRA